MADISKIKLPDGITYDIKDAVARAALGGGSMVITWPKSALASASAPSTTTKASIPDAAYAYYNNAAASVAGSLVAASADKNKFYLVAGVTTDPSGSTKGGDFYDEWVAIQDGSSYAWEKVGDTQFTGDLNITTASFVKTLASGTHTHNYASTSGVTISSGASSGPTVATGGITTSGSVSLASSSSTSTGAVQYVQSIGSAAAQGHTHSVTVGTTRLNVSRTTDAVVGASNTYIYATGSGGGYASPTKSYFLTSAAGGGTGTVTASMMNVTTDFSEFENNLVTTSIRPAKTITTSDFVTSGTTTRFGQVAAYTGLTGTVTAVTGRSQATVATGSLDSNGSGSSVVTDVKAPNTVQGRTSKDVVTAVGGATSSSTSNYIQSISSKSLTKVDVVSSATVSGTVVTGATDSAGNGRLMYFASVNGETLEITGKVLETSSQSVTTNNYGVRGSYTLASGPVAKAFTTGSIYEANAPSATSLTVSSSKLETATIYQANSPASTSVSFTPTTTNVIGATAVTSGASVNIITAVTKDSKTLDPRATAVTVATGAVSADGTGATVVTGVSKTSGQVVGALAGTTTFLTSVSAGSAEAITALGDQTAISIAVSNGASAAGRALAVRSASISTQPVITLSTVSSGGVAVGAAGAVTTASTTTAAATVTTRYLTASHSDPVLTTTKLSATPTNTTVSTGNNTGTVITGIGTEGLAVIDVKLQ